MSERRETWDLRGLNFHDDNAKSHRTWITNEFLLKNHVEQYENAVYSSDWSPCDFFLFPKLKKQLRGIRFNDDDEMLTAFEQAIDNLTKENLKNCFAVVSNLKVEFNYSTIQVKIGGDLEGWGGEGERRVKGDGGNKEKIDEHVFKPPHKLEVGELNTCSSILSFFPPPPHTLTPQGLPLPSPE